MPSSSVIAQTHPPFNLKGSWDSICSEAVSLELPPARWKHQWSCTETSAKRLYQCIALQKPKVIVETGTFEGLGTFVMAQAAHENNNHCRIYTIDYDGDPTTQLPLEEWLQLKEFRAQNLDLIRNRFPNVTLTFLEGDSRQVLPQLFSNSLTHWDFFYQDSMHFMEGILAEWDVMRPFAKSGSVVVFDDVALTGKSLTKHIIGRAKDFCSHFFWHEVLNGSWSYQSVTKDRLQFWAQKTKAD